MPDSWLAQFSMGDLALGIGKNAALGLRPADFTDEASLPLRSLGFRVNAEPPWWWVEPGSAPDFYYEISASLLVPQSSKPSLVTLSAAGLDALIPLAVVGGHMVIRYLDPGLSRYLYVHIPHRKSLVVNVGQINRAYLRGTKLGQIGLPE